MFQSFGQKKEERSRKSYGNTARSSNTDEKSKAPKRKLESQDSPASSPSSPRQEELETLTEVMRTAPSALGTEKMQQLHVPDEKGKGGPRKKLKETPRQASGMDEDERRSEAMYEDVQGFMSATVGGGPLFGGVTNDPRTPDTGEDWQTQRRASLKSSRVASWAAYTASLLHDLTVIQERVKPETLSKPVVREYLARAVTSVLLYKSHAAAFLNLDPRLPRESPSSVRQESPWDVRYPEVYYRSQREGHPQITLYREGVRFALAPEEGKPVPKKLKQLSSDLLAPYNWEAKESLAKATESGTVFNKSVRISPAIQQKDSLAVALTGHKEPIAGHAGMRATNPQAVMEMVKRLLAHEKGIARLMKFLRLKVADFGVTLPKPAPSAELKLPQMWKLFDQIMETFSGVEEVRAKEPLPPTADVNAEDPYFSESYVTRKLGQTSLRAQQLAGRLSGLSRLDVKRQANNPQITIELKQFPEVAALQEEDEGGELRPDYVGLIQAVRIYLSAEIARSAARAGLPLSAAMRQSFGFLDSSLALTDPSIRLSVGTEPAAYLVVLEQAIKNVNGELDALVSGEKTPSGLNKAVFGTEGIRMPLRTLGRGGSANDLIAYYQTLKTESKLGEHLRYIMEELYEGEDKSKEKWAMLPELARQADKVLSASHREEAESDPDATYGGGLPVLEPLSNLLAIAADVVTRLSSQMLDAPLSNSPSSFASTRTQALVELSSSIARVYELASALPGKPGERVRAHAELRDAAEEIGESLLILLASQERVAPQTPQSVGSGKGARTVEGRVTEFFRGALKDEVPVETFRADSGEQAGMLTFAALNAEANKKLRLEADSEETYFEFNSFFKENAFNLSKPDDASADALFVDPRPYLNKVRTDDELPPDFREKVKAALAKLDSGEQRATPFTVVLDVTNIDYTHPQIVGLLQSAVEQMKSERVRFVLFYSGIKHEEMGLDKYQVGKTIVIGKQLQGLKTVSDNVLVTQFTEALQNLRDLDRSATAELVKLIREAADSDPLTGSPTGGGQLSSDKDEPGPPDRSSGMRGGATYRGQTSGGGSSSSGGVLGSFFASTYGVRPEETRFQNDLFAAKQESFMQEVRGGKLLNYMNVNNASDKGDNCLINSVAHALGSPPNEAVISNVRSRLRKLGKGIEPNNYLNLEAIPTILNEFGAAKTEVVVIFEPRASREGWFPAEFVNAGGSGPIFVVNISNIHFGWGTLRSGFTAERADGPPGEFVGGVPGIQFRAQ